MRTVRPHDLSKFRKEQNKSLKIKDGFFDPITWIDTGNFALNKMISNDFFGGIPIGSVSGFAGESGCLPATAKVRIREKIVTVGELRELYHQNEFDIEIDTPDGFQKITSWWDKGILPMVSVNTANHSSTCAVNHMIQLASGEWLLADELAPGDEIITRDGVAVVVGVEDAGEAECYDFEVDHPNHRYWGDDLSSHNSGKSYIVSGNLVKNALEMGVSVILLDTEGAVKKKWASALGVDTDHPNLIRWSKTTINQVAKTVADFMDDDYIPSVAGLSREEQPPILFVLDSLGNLDTESGIEQFEKGDLKGDMGVFAKQSKMLLKNCIRTFDGYQVGMVFTNHTYKNQNMYSDREDIITGGCLVAGSKVWLSDGTTKSIEDMEVGDTVQTLYGDQKVCKLWHYNKPTFTIELTDGQSVTCSPEHKFLVACEQGMIWKSAQDIDCDDEILSV